MHVAEEMEMADNNLFFESKVSELLTTMDSNSLEPGCTQSYYDEAGKKTTAMFDEISSSLASSSCATIVSPITQARSLTAIGGQASCLDTISIYIATMVIAVRAHCNPLDIYIYVYI